MLRCYHFGLILIMSAGRADSRKRHSTVVPRFVEGKRSPEQQADCIGKLDSRRTIVAEERRTWPSISITRS